MRIVKQIELHPEPYHVGQTPVVTKRGMPLKTLQQKKASLLNEKRLKELEEEIIQTGLRQVESKGMTLIAQHIKRLSDESRKEWDKVFNEVSDVIVGLAMEIASKLCRKEISQDSSIAMEWTREALGRIGGDGKALVKVHLSEVEVVRGIQRELLAQTRGLKELIIQEDLSVEPGGCLVEGDTVVVDATVSTRLLEIERGLEGS